MAGPGRSRSALERLPLQWDTRPRGRPLQQLPPLNEQQSAPMQAEWSERRHGTDRRRHTLRALLQGSLTPRRRGPRRANEHAVAAVDWHHPQWLAIAMLIVVFCSADAFLTLLLMERGAREVNPFMAPLVNGSSLRFALVKIGATASGVVLLTQLARLRAFGRLPVGALLYSVLALYALLIAYELKLLNML